MFTTICLSYTFCFPSVLSPVDASPSTDLIIGQQLNLTCKLSSRLPTDVNVNWTTPAESSYPSVKSNPHPTRLFIPSVGAADSGKWGCALWQGSERLTSDVITLKIGEHRKWEQSRKYDRGMTLWPQSFTAETRFYGALSVLYTV